MSSKLELEGHCTASEDRRPAAPLAPSDIPVLLGFQNGIAEGSRVRNEVQEKRVILPNLPMKLRLELVGLWSAEFKNEAQTPSW